MRSVPTTPSVPNGDRACRLPKPQLTPHRGPPHALSSPLYGCVCLLCLGCFNVQDIKQRGVSWGRRINGGEQMVVGVPRAARTQVCGQPAAGRPLSVSPRRSRKGASAFVHFPLLHLHLPHASPQSCVSD